jgi:hypothetical protein
MKFGWGSCRITAQTWVVALTDRGQLKETCILGNKALIELAQRGLLAKNQLVKVHDFKVQIVSKDFFAAGTVDFFRRKGDKKLAITHIQDLEVVYSPETLQVGCGRSLHIRL